MELDGLKTSLNTKCADVIIGDVDIIKNAPIRMLTAGLGDMIAKYISICEWRISHIVTGEYYCEYVADMVRSALKKCVDNADGLLRRDEEAVAAVFEGLVIGGVAMTYAGISRPASGVEHYFSHVFDMRGLEFGTSTDFHGIQCAIGTLVAARIYEKVKNITPDREKALAFNAAFDYGAWKKTLSEYIGTGAEAMIKLEAKERKYDVELHRARLEIILSHWNEILAIIEEELPSAAELEGLLTRIGCPLSFDEIAPGEFDLPTVFRATKDIRDKYVLSRLCHDLGIIDEIEF
jgi:glycerol-1-phosphate dehydrogenase [NAD(P)+]